MLPGIGMVKIYWRCLRLEAMQRMLTWVTAWNGTPLYYWFSAIFGSVFLCRHRCFSETHCTISTFLLAHAGKHFCYSCFCDFNTVQAAHWSSSMRACIENKIRIVCTLLIHLHIHFNMSKPSSQSFTVTISHQNAGLRQLHTKLYAAHKGLRCWKVLQSVLDWLILLRHCSRSIHLYAIA